METVVIVIHLMVVVALIAVVLLQRSEGGALGIGGSNNFMTARGQGNVLTRATTILGATFFLTSIAMSILARLDAPPSSILQAPADTAPITAPAGSGDGTGDGQGILNQLETFTGQSIDGSTPPADSGAGTTQPSVPTTE